MSLRMNTSNVPALSLSVSRSLYEPARIARAHTAGGKADVQGHTCPSYIKMVIDKA